MVGLKECSFHTNARFSIHVKMVPFVSSFYRICGPLLNMWVDEVRKLVESYEEV